MNGGIEEWKEEGKEEGMEGRMEGGRKGGRDGEKEEWSNALAEGLQVEILQL